MQTTVFIRTKGKCIKALQRQHIDVGYVKGNGVNKATRYKARARPGTARALGSNANVMGCKARAKDLDFKVKAKRNVQ